MRMHERTTTMNNHSRFLVSLSFLLVAVSHGPSFGSEVEVQRFGLHEMSFEAENEYSNPYLDVAVRSTFTGPNGQTMVVPGFWDGGKTFKVRFTPTSAGLWNYSVNSQPIDDGLCAKGDLQVSMPKTGKHGFLRRDTEFPTSFIHDDGTRRFMWGTTMYHLLLNASAGQRWKEAIDGATRHGINKVRFSLAPSDADGRSGGYKDTKPFLDEARQRLNLDHWRTADHVIGYLNDHNCQADVILFWRMHEKEISQEKREADERYLRYALARYAAFPNVIWCMVNEWNYSSVPREYWNDLGRLVRSEDPWSRNGGVLRAHSIHQQTRPDWNFADQEWPSHAILQLGVRNRGASVRIGDEWKAAPIGAKRFTFGDDWGNHSIVRNWIGTYPIVNDEYGYIGELFDDSAGGSKRKNRPVRFTRDKHRRTMWGIAVGGGYGSTGNKNDYGRDGKPYFSANWHETPEHGDVARLIDFFTVGGIEYWKMSPDNDLVGGERVYALVEPARQYVVYVAAGGEFSLKLGDGTYTASRLDPATGNTLTLGQVDGGEQSFTTPIGHDWVVWCRRVE